VIGILISSLTKLAGYWPGLAHYDKVRDLGSWEAWEKKSGVGIETVTRFNGMEV
jgi:hypothetical protein